MWCHFRPNRLLRRRTLRSREAAMGLRHLLPRRFFILTKSTRCIWPLTARARKWACAGRMRGLLSNMSPFGLLLMVAETSPNTNRARSAQKPTPKNLRLAPWPRVPLTLRSQFVLYPPDRPIWRAIRLDGNNGHHPARGSRCFLCVGRANARPFFARKTHRCRWRCGARRFLRSQIVWCQQWHVRAARPRSVSTTDLC